MRGNCRLASSPCAACRRRRTTTQRGRPRVSAASSARAHPAVATWWCSCLLPGLCRPLSSGRLCVLGWGLGRRCLLGLSLCVSCCPLACALPAPLCFACLLLPCAPCLPASGPVSLEPGSRQLPEHPGTPRWGVLLIWVRLPRAAGFLSSVAVPGGALSGRGCACACFFFFFFFFSRDGVTDLKTPRGGGQRQEPKHQEPSRPEPALKQAPRARRRQDRTGQDRTRPSAGGEQRGEQAGTHTRKHTSKRSGHRGLAKRRRGPQDTYKRLTEPTSNNLTKLQPVPRAS
jgi:hypothetical protein